MIKIREIEQQKKKEKYLYKIVKKVLSWTDVEAEDEEIWDLIMLDLIYV